LHYIKKKANPRELKRQRLAKNEDKRCLKNKCKKEEGTFYVPGRGHWCKRKLGNKEPCSIDTPKGEEEEKGGIRDKKRL